MNDAPLCEPSAGAVVLRRTTAIAVVVAAGSLAAFETPHLVDLFLGADETLQSAFFLLDARPLLSVAAHLALILVGLHRLLAAPAAAFATRIPARWCYGALALELLSFAPCVGAAGALCGMFYILLSPVTAIAVLIGFAVYLKASRSRVLGAASGLTLALAVGSALAAYGLVTPHSPAECERIDDPIKRGSCVMNFALQRSDEELCEQVYLDSSRWSCLYQIAERKGEPAPCERIVLPCRVESPGPFCDPDRYRNTCLILVATKLRDPRLCEAMKPGEQQSRCREHVK